MSNEEWKKVEEKLSGVFGVVELKIDGYKVSVQKVLISETMLAYMVYVNGEFRGSWLIGDCEERRRFLCRHERCFTSGKTLSNYAKVFGKKSDFYIKAAQKYSWYTPYWRSFSSMKSHFIQNNKSIELM